MNPRPPHIAVVASYFYPKIGGLENYAYFLAKNLQERNGYRISVITSNYDGVGYKKEIIDGMTVHRLPIAFTLSNTPINLFWQRQIRRIFSADPPDIIHLHSPVPYMADVAARAAGTAPIALTYHSGSMKKGSWPIDIFIGAYERIGLKALFQRADAIITISQNFARQTFPQFLDKMYFIPTGVDVERFKKTPLPTISERVTYVGRIEHSSSWKGIDQLLQAMKIVIAHRPHATLELVGGGDAVEYYRSRAHELGIGASVILSGPLVDDEIVRAYQRANIVVLASTSDAEAFSIALVEAMASGRPIIGSDVGGIPQAIKHGHNGLLVPPRDPRALAMAIEQILSDRTLAATLANNGAAIAQNFTWTIQTERYAKIFSTLL
jgi:glycosyltransferase involved in cell wall biosynthesis